MEEKAIVSVVIPMYNAENTIERTLNSVINQTFRGMIEIIVINDGSNDSSQQVVENFIQSHPNSVIKLINQQNGGVSKARNIGLKRASGDYIALLDSDDEWICDKLEKQIHIFRTQDVDFVCALRNNEKIEFPYVINNNLAKITLRSLLIKVVGQTSTSMFKRKVIGNTGYFDENQKYSEDVNYWMRISLNNKMVIMNEQLVMTDNDYGQLGLSSNLKEMEKGVQKNINEIFKLQKINLVEYLFFKSFSKFKHVIRILKSKK